MIKVNLFTSHSKTIKYILEALFGIVLFALILSSLGNVLRKKGEITLRWNEFYELSSDENIDVLILGSSQAFRGVDPSVFENELNMSAYNLSTPAQVISQTYYTLEESLRHTSPKLVIVEMNYAEKSNLLEDRWYFAYEEVASMKFSKNKLTYIFDLFNFKTYINAFFPAIREHENWKDRETIDFNLNALLHDEKVVEMDMFNGYVQDFSQLSEANISKYKTADYHKENYSINENSEKYINKIIATCNENNITLLFIKTAFPKEYLEKTNYEDKFNSINTIAEKNNIPYLDFNMLYSEINFQPKDFRDEFNLMNHHLNTNGAKKTSQYIINYIKSISK